MGKEEIESAIGVLESWGRFEDNWVLICAAGVALFLAFEVVFSVAHWRNERALRPLRTEQAKLHSTELAELGKDIAAAKAETAKANAAADAARLETERLKVQFAWRTLPPTMASQLKNLLSQHPGRINIQHVTNDPESLYLAIQFANLFEQAHWQVATLSLTMGGMLVFGLWIPDSSAPDLATVRGAFQTARIGFATDPLPTAGVSIGMGGTLQDAPTLFVGSKPIPQ